MNPKKNRTCTRGPWGYSCTSGSGIRGIVVHAYRVRPGVRAIQRGTIYGLSIDLGDFDRNHDEYARLGLLYGYTQYHGRNTGRFVMSRAARKRGYTTTDRAYNHRVVLGKPTY